MKLFYTKRASSDLNGILDYVYERNRQAASDIIQALESLEETLIEFPNVGKLTDIENVRVAPLGRYPYLLFWNVSDESIKVLHIRDARQKPWQGE